MRTNNDSAAFPTTLPDPAYSITVKMDGAAIAVFQFTKGGTLERSTYRLEDIPDLLRTSMLLEVAAMQLRHTASVSFGLLSSEMKRMADDAKDMRGQGALSLQAWRLFCE